MIVPAQQDAVGSEIQAALRGERAIEIIERDDGFIDVSGGPAAYLRPYPRWPVTDRKAMRFVRGRVLDVGCGAGRACLHLQERGHEVVGIDNSPGAIEACRQRGVVDARVFDFVDVDEELGTYDTIIMLGNNFGLFGTPARARRMLQRLMSLTTDRGRIVATSVDVHMEPVAREHRAYHERNRKRGRLAGQIRIRVRYRGLASPWFNYLMVSPDEMREIVDGTGWHVALVITVREAPFYATVLEKV